MTSETVVRWFHENFGGEVFVTQPPSANYQVRFAWQLRGRNIIPLLEAVLPYLREKKERAKLVIRLAQMVRDRHVGRTTPLTQQEISERSEIAAAIKAFNRDPRSEDAVQ
jgi:hypothetical protein